MSNRINSQISVIHKPKSMSDMETSNQGWNDYTDITGNDLWDIVTTNVLAKQKAEEEEDKEEEDFYDMDFSSSSRLWLQESKWFNSRYKSNKKSKKSNFEIVMLLRSLENYVKILTGKNIKIQITDAVTGSTNGERIIIPSKYTLEEIDVAIGMVLHEASHIQYTDFKLTSRMDGYISLGNFSPNESASHLAKEFIDSLAKGLSDPLNSVQTVHLNHLTNIVKLFNDNSTTHNVIKTRNLNLTNYKLIFNHAIFPLFNYIEDIYIDDATYSKIPSYRDYYEKLNTSLLLESDDVLEFLNMDPQSIIDVQSGKHNSPISLYDLYLGKIVACQFGGNDLSTLPYMQEIYDLIDPANIRRLTTTESRMQLVLEVFNVILKDDNVLTSVDVTNQPTKQVSNLVNPFAMLVKSIEQELAESEQAGNPDPIRDERLQELLELFSDMNITVIDAFLSNTSQHNSDYYDGDITVLLSEDDINTYNNDNVKIRFNIPDVGSKSSNGLSFDDVAVINSLKNNNNISLIKNKYRLDNSNLYYDYKHKDVISGNVNVEFDTTILNNIETFLTKNGTRNNFGENGLPIVHELKSHTYGEAVNKGLLKGKSLAKKLSFRNTDYILKTNRQKSGKLDNTIMHQLGILDASATHNSNSAIDRVFYNTQVDYYNDYIYFLDIDLSGSIDNMMPTIIEFSSMLVGAFNELEGVDIVVTGRITHEYDTLYGIPTNSTLVFYDSRVDNLQKFRRVMKSATVTSYSTSEMICYENIRVMANEVTDSRKKVIISLTDGGPNGTCKLAKINGKDQPELKFNTDSFKSMLDQFLKRIKQDNIEFMCFYLTTRTDNHVHPQFESLYGKYGKHINLKDINEIGKIINKQLKQMDCK